MDNASVEKRENVVQLVALHVVDRVACNRYQLECVDAVERLHHRIDRVHVQRLLRLVHRQQAQEARVLPIPVDELEAGGRLDVGHVQVSDVRDHRDRVLGLNRASIFAVDEIAPDDVRLAFELAELVVLAARTLTPHRSRAKAALRGQHETTVTRWPGTSATRRRWPRRLAARRSGTTPFLSPSAGPRWHLRRSVPTFPSPPGGPGARHLSATGSGRGRRRGTPPTALPPPGAARPC